MHLAGQEPLSPRELGVLNHGNVTYSLTAHPLLPRTKKGHTHTSARGNQNPGLPFGGGGQNWLNIAP